MKIHILLPVHNRLGSTRLFVQSLLSQSFNNYHLILIDDGSSDGTAEYVKAKVKDASIVTGQGHWWWAGGLHQGYLKLKNGKVNKNDFVLMINNDTEFEADFLEKGIDILSKNHRTLLLAQAYGKENLKLIESGVYVDWKHLKFQQVDKGKKINCLSTRGLFLRVEDFFNIGGFHPIALPHYLSDYEFTIRAYHKGYALMTDPALSLVVDEGSTGHHGLDGCCGRIEFYKKYFSNRSAENPFCWLTFVAMACPWPWKIINVWRVLYGGVAVVLKVLIQGADYQRIK